MKLTFLHVVGYVTGILTFVAGLNPALAGAVVGPAGAPYVVPVIAGAGAALVFLHDVGVIPAPASTITNVAKVLPLVLAVSVVVGSFSACATLMNPTTPAAQSYVIAAVDVAVAAAESKGIPATQINAICKTALAADSGTAATLATVATVVNAQLAKLSLPAGDLVAAQILEDALSVAIQSQVGANPNVATAQAAIADVLNAAIAATGG
jgi:hypothetical protein